MTLVAIVLFVGPAVLLVVLVAYAAALRTRHHYTSVLTCPHCQRTFEYDWVPLASFSAVRLGKTRYLQCPFCHEWSNFEIWSTRIGDPGKDQRAKLS